MQPTKRLWLLIAGLLIFPVGCSDDKDDVNEAQVLVEYLEGNGDYLNTGVPSLVTASDVQIGLASSANFYIIDLRSAADFTAGHIDGAHNVAMADLRTHMESINAASYEKIIITCYSGQTAAYATSLMRLLGYNNTFAMKFGMSAWHADFAANYWSAKTSNVRASEFETTDHPKAAAGELPVLNTGHSHAEDILIARVDELLAAGFTPALITEATVFASPTNYYIVNYWPTAHYLDPGHIPGAINYVPKQDLKLSTALTTLPTDQPIVVYCYTGTTSAFVVAYLRLLGYDARSLAYGVNAMIYDVINGVTGFTTFKASDIMNYSYVTG